MNLVRITLATALAFAPVGLLVPTSHAAVPTCNGLEATIVGTDAQDKLTGTAGPDVVVLGGGGDVFYGLGGDDVICGGDGGDSISPGTGDDTVLGEAGNDVVHEAAGDDDLDGGDGTDRLFYRAYGGLDLRLDARVGKATSTNGTDLFAGFESYVGSQESDTIIGGRNAERIDSLSGEQDVVYGMGGDDRITNTSHQNDVVVVDGGDGNDVVSVNAASARVRLGSGDDKLYYYYVRAAGSWFDGGTGVDQMITTSQRHGFEINLNRKFIAATDSGVRMPLGGFENAHGGSWPDRLVGNAGSNRLWGGGGNDLVLGLGGNDVLNGGNWDDYDIADGGTGADRCFGFDQQTSC